MSSTFRRRNRDAQTTLSSTSAQATPILRGTRPWTGGVTLTSVGLRDLDSILGGGQSLGTCLLLEDDRWTPDLALCLTRYWCAEAVAHEQTLLIVTSRDDDATDLTRSAPSLAEKDDEDSSKVLQAGASYSQVQDLLQSLPRNLHRDKEEGSIARAEINKAQPLEILAEEDEETAEAGLTIAWQYKKSVQQQRLGHGANTAGISRGTPGKSDIFCHSYDLSGRLTEQLSPDWWSREDSHVHVVNGHGCQLPSCRMRQCGYRLYQKLLKQLKQKKTKGGSTVVRLLLHLAPIPITAVALPLLLSHIRAHRLPVVVLVTTQAWTCPSRTSLSSLRRTSDVVMQTQGFVSRVHYPPPPEFRHLHGLLLLPKVSVVTAATAHGGGHFADMINNKRPPAHVYGLKRDRRKLHIPLLHIPPEDYAGGGSSVGSGVRSGAGRPRDKESTSSKGGVGCGSGTASLLDF